MPIPIAFLLAAQAGGMIIDYLGTEDQINMAKTGAMLEQKSIENNIQTSRLQYEEESLQSMVNLRKNMGTQAAMLAARGTRAGAGTALSFTTESISNFNSDERLRKINQLSDEAQLRAGLLTSKLHEKTFENNTWSEFTRRMINKVPTDPSSYSEIGKSFGLTKVRGS